MTARCAPAPTFSYFVVMLDCGRKGREAIVDPEITRREVVSRILTHEYDPERIVFIHHVTPDGVEDITFDLIAECARETLDQSPCLSGQDAIDWQNDHNRDLRKHGVLS